MFLLDAVVVSELRRARSGRTHPRVAAWAEATPAAEPFVSVIALHGIGIGVLLMERRDPRQGAVPRRWHEGTALPGFEGRIRPVALAVARRCASPTPGPPPLPGPRAPCATR